ncbi:unnamed protein product [Rhizophagus irregularis]|uniref:Uncharacterized protein n=1 Tax=Rhizophagus irregularis TaxID=588596 RepID=A0A916E224_9GLOM|nr:unnamed protein product [Rhizophagus irregularis]CAB5349503.1 unnamed protein product [Rhizophagus irregularis]
MIDNYSLNYALLSRPVLSVIYKIDRPTPKYLIIIHNKGKRILTYIELKTTNNDINSVNEITGIYYRHPTLGEAIILLTKTNDPFDDFVEHETYVAATIGGSDLKLDLRVTMEIPFTHD